MSDRLAPCPFCGGEARRVSGGRDWNEIVCDCGANMEADTSTEDATVAAWNRRAQPSGQGWVALKNLHTIVCRIAERQYAQHEERVDKYGPAGAGDDWRIRAEQSSAIAVAIHRALEELPAPPEEPDNG